MKTIFFSITATLTAISFAATLFLNTILGAFGLVSTSVETLSNLRSSQQVVEKMKTRHKARRLNVTKKFAKRATRRVTSASLAAAAPGIGVAAVVVTMIGFEVHDYCEDKESLQNDYNILYGTEEEFNFNKCVDEGKNDSKQILIDVKKSASDNVTAAMESTAEYGSEKWLTVKESSIQAFSSTSDATNDLWDFTKDWLDN